jgi:outer membrane protein assembly factor BamB
VGDVVVVGAGAIERAVHLPIESPGYMLRVRISDGHVLSRQEVIDPESSPALSPDGVAYIGSGINGCAVLAFATTGGLLWKTPTPYPATGAVLLSDDLVVAGCGRGDFVNAAPHSAGAVLAIESSSGKVRWQTELGDAVLGSLSIGDGKVFCPVRDGTVAALDVHDAKEVWRQRISNAPVLAGTTQCGECVYAVSSDGFLAILDVKSGQVIEQHLLNDEANPGRRNLCVSKPEVADGRVFVGSETGGLKCFVGAASR